MERAARFESHKSFRYLHIPGKPGGPCVVLFHGYGADAQDLAPLSQYMRLSADVTWIFPEGPLTVPIAPGFEGRAWFPIDLRRFERAMEDEDFTALMTDRPRGMDSSMEKVKAFLTELRPKHSKMALGGFSQGSMISLDAVLHGAPTPDALILLSGTLVDQENWRQRAQTVSGIDFFQSHGTSDPVLAYESAQLLYEMLETAGWAGEFHGFNGGHEIPPQVLRKLIEFLTPRGF